MFHQNVDTGHRWIVLPSTSLRNAYLSNGYSVSAPGHTPASQIRKTDGFGRGLEALLSAQLPASSLHEPLKAKPFQEID
jgi:hypothetical protein